MITAIVIGAGDRGTIYANYALKTPDFTIVGVADPNKIRRDKFADTHILTTHIYESWEDILNEEKFADAAIITTPDKIHIAPAIKALQKGYAVLLEKPMTADPEKLKLLIAAIQASKGLLQVCHVLRYTKFYSTIHKLLQEQQIGDIVQISMEENVSYYHYAHSFIRGNWHNRDASSPMILAKCSHDLDLIYWFADSEPEYITSTGGLDHFNIISLPIPAEQIPNRCTDGCPLSNECLYYAPRTYIDIIPILHIAAKQKGIKNIFNRFAAKAVLQFPGLKRLPIFNRIAKYSGWPVSILTTDTSLAGRLHALNTGPYGRCVYKISDHDVVDHQVVTITFKNGISAILKMQGHSFEEGRTIRIDGTKGTITGKFLPYSHFLEVHDSLTNKTTVIINDDPSGGHGGGDTGLIQQFVASVAANKRGENANILTTAENSIVSHLLAYAADTARLEKKVVNFKEF